MNTDAFYAEEDPKPVRLGGRIGWCTSLCNLFGCLSFQFSPKKRVVLIELKRHVVLLASLLLVVYMLPMLSCPPQDFYSNTSNIGHSEVFDLAQDSGRIVSLHPIHPIDAIVGPIRGVASMVTRHIGYFIAKARHSIISDDVLQSLENKALLATVDKANISSIMLQFYHIQRVLLSKLRSYTDVQQYLPATHIDSKTHESIPREQLPIWVTNQRIPGPAVRINNAVCKSLYGSQEFISNSITMVMDTTVDIITTLVDLMGIPHPPYNPFTGQGRASAYLRSLTAQIATPNAPSWFLYRLGQPIANFLYTTAHMLIPPSQQVMLRATSFLQTSILRAVVELEIAEVLYWYETGELYGKQVKSTSLGLDKSIIPSSTLAQYGMHISDIAHVLCADVENLHRLLDAASNIGVFYEITPNRWVSTPMSRPLRKDSTDSLAWAVLMFGNEQFMAQSNLAHSIRTGMPAFSLVYGDFWEFHALSQRTLGQTKEELIQLGKQQQQKNNNKDKQQDSENTNIYDFDIYVRKVGSCHNIPDITTATPLDVTTEKPITDITLKPSFGSETSNLSSDVTMLNIPYKTNLYQDTDNNIKYRTNNAQIPLWQAYLEFNNGMESIATTVTPIIAAETRIWGQLDTLFDVAGGKGHLISAIVQHNPSINTAVVFDLPYTYADNDVYRGTIDNMNLATIAQTAFNNDNTSTTAAQCSKRPVPDMIYKPVNAPHTKDGDKSTSAAVVNSIDKGTVVYMKQITSDKDTKTTTTTTITTGDSQSLVNLCPASYIHAGSFFEANTMSSSYTYNKIPILHKMVNILSNASQQDLDKISTTRYHIHHKTAATMMQILHDWSNTESIQILNNLRASLLSLPSYTEQQGSLQLVLPSSSSSLPEKVKDAWNIVKLALPLFVFNNESEQTQYELYNTLCLVSAQASKTPEQASAPTSNAPYDIISSLSQSNKHILQSTRSIMQPFCIDMTLKLAHCAQDGIRQDINGQEYVVSCYKSSNTTNNKNKQHKQEKQNIIDYNVTSQHLSLSHDKRVYIIDRLIHATPLVVDIPFTASNLSANTSSTTITIDDNDIDISTLVDQSDINILMGNEPIIINTSSLSSSKDSKYHDKHHFSIPSPSLINNHGSALANILMTNNFNKAKERNINDLYTICKQSGYILTRVIPTRFMYSIIEAKIDYSQVIPPSLSLKP